MASNWLDKIAVVPPTQPLIAAKIPVDIKRTVYKMVFAERQLKIAYRRRDNVEKQYHLNPLGLVVRGHITYLIATKLTIENPQLFALHRILSAEETNLTCAKPDNFQLVDFINQGNMDFYLTMLSEVPDGNFKAIFHNDIIKFLEETPLSIDQYIQAYDNENHILTATINITEQLYWWLLGYSYQVEVLEPITLRNRIKEAVKKSAQRYCS